MAHIVLLGDSIFDNRAYVGRGPAVIDQLRERLPGGDRATLAAVDGSVIGAVHRQLATLPADASHLVVSAGGNDVLGEVGALGVAVKTVGEGMRTLAAIRERILSDYERLLEAIRDRGLPAAVCTIYEPQFPDAMLRREAVTALCLFNDAILRAALAFGLPVLDLRAVCTDVADYANPIEPSSAGGAKIADAIVALLRELGERPGRTFLAPSGMNIENRTGS